MMAPKILPALIAQGEGERLEFKKTLTHPHKLARTLAAFANTRGGTVLIGVLDNGHLSGVRDVEEERFALNQAAALVAPPIQLTITEVETTLPDTGAEAVVLRADVAESARKPHRARQPNGEERVYVRAGAESVQASGVMEKVLRHDDAPAERLPPRPLSRAEAAALALLPATAPGQRAPRLTEAQLAHALNFSARRTRQLLRGLTIDGFLLRHDREGTPFWTRLG